MDTLTDLCSHLFDEIISNLWKEGKYIVCDILIIVLKKHLQFLTEDKSNKEVKFKMPEVLTLSSMADAEPDLSTFENKSGLAEDMKFLASMPELCDVTFLVGDTREPVCAVKVGGICILLLDFLCVLIHCVISDYKYNYFQSLKGCVGGTVAGFPKDALSSSITTTQEGSTAT